MSPLSVAIITVLSVIFIVVALKAVLMKKVSYIVTSVSELSGIAELRLRALMRKNPHSEIYVASNVTDSETEIILNKMSEDYPQIHIIHT